jgi:hypothetical protein
VNDEQDKPSRSRFTDISDDFLDGG